MDTMIEQAKMKAQGLYRQAQMNVETPYAEQIAENERIDKTTTNEMLDCLDKELAELNQIVMYLYERTAPILRTNSNDKNCGVFAQREDGSPLTNNIIHKINAVRAIQSSLKNLINNIDL
jgi:hypothetical protein